MIDTALPKPNPQVLFTEIDDGTGVLLHLDTKFYYALNRTAVVVWKAIAEGKCATLGAIAARLSEAFRVEPGVAERDVTAILDEMVADGLLLAPRRP